MNPDQRVDIPTMAMVLDWPAIELILEGLGKLTIDRAGRVHRAIEDAAQQHLQAALDAAKAPAPAEPKPKAARKPKAAQKPPEAT